jgi:hypothetical protein
MKLFFIQNIVGFFLGAILMGSGCSRTSVVTPSPSDSTASSQPALMGRLFFHSYSCYSCGDSKLYRYDFGSRTLTEISAGWPIQEPMNLHVAPDGKSLVFMGKMNTSGWDVFRWRIGSAALPDNLTASFGNTRDEDPKYSFDGFKIVFKQNGVMKEMDTTGRLIRSLPVTHTEASMPYYAKGDSVLLYSGNEATGSTADIYSLRLSNGAETPLSALPGVEEYYPITRDDTSFYFTCWYSADNHNDQVYLGFHNGRPATRLAFNETYQNYSDACPVSNRYLIVSSTTPGGRGSYDLYVADLITGKRWSMDLYLNGINTSKNELGACYSQ